MKPPEVQLGVLEAAEKARAASGRPIAEAALDLAEDAVRVDDYDTAEKLLKLAARSAARSNLSPLIGTVSAHTSEFDAIRKAFQELEPVRKTLKSNPDDPAANARIGHFLCIQKGDWNAGLPLLAKSSEEKLKAAARDDLALPVAAVDRAAVADRWFDAADLYEGAERAEVRARAYQWYLQAAADLTGLSKSRLEKRMAAFLAQMNPRWSDFGRANNARIFSSAPPNPRSGTPTPVAAGATSPCP